MKTAIIPILAALLLGLHSHSHQEAETPLLPERIDSGWSRTESPRTFTQADLYNYIDGGAEVFLEFGFSRLVVNRYSNGRDDLTIEMYEMEDATAALGVYLVKRGPEHPVPGVSPRSTGEPSQITACHGRLFLQANNPSGSEKNMAAMIDLINRATAVPAGETPATALDLLPRENRVPESELLIRGPVVLQNLVTLGDGDILSQNGKLYAAAADFRRGNGSVSTTVIIRYPDTQQGEAALRHLAANLDPYLKVAESRADRLRLRDFQNRPIDVSLVGSTLTINLEPIPIPQK